MPLVARRAISFIKVIRYAFVCAHAGHIFLLRSRFVGCLCHRKLPSHKHLMDVSLVNHRRACEEFYTRLMSDCVAKAKPLM